MHTCITGLLSLSIILDVSTLFWWRIHDRASKFVGLFWNYVEPGNPLVPNFNFLYVGFNRCIISYLKRNKIVNLKSWCNHVAHMPLNFFSNQHEWKEFSFLTFSEIFIFVKVVENTCFELSLFETIWPSQWLCVGGDISVKNNNQEIRNTPFNFFSKEEHNLKFSIRTDMFEVLRQNHVLYCRRACRC